MFYSKIKNSLNESDVSSLYKNVMFKGFPKCEIVSPYNTDGILIDKKAKLKMLMEFKYNKDFRNKTEINGCLIQSLYYLKKFEDDGNRLPEIIFVGDKNECFCIHTNDIVKYLDYDINWKIAPSSAAKKNPKLLKDMYEDKNIKPYVFYIDEKFNFKDVVDKIVSLRSGIKKLIRITEKNINNIFNLFIKGILKSKMDANKKVSIFVNVLLYPDDNYLHPTRKNTLVTRSFGDVKIKSDTFISFFEHFDRKYTPAQKEKLTAICDRLIEDTTRRFQGEFYTPTEWVNEAHRMIEAEFGEDWKEEYIVWDPAWGTGNLTRDYSFKELYCSTLNQSDLDIGAMYNTNAVKFQFDFLNDNDLKLPEELQAALNEGKKMIVFMNPPFFDIGTSVTKINKQMKLGDWGASSQQLYTQFLYKLHSYNSDNINICTFAKPLYFSGSSFKKFRLKFFNKFEFKSGMLFSAGYFSNVSAKWGISFSIFKVGKSNNKYNFKHILKDLDSESGYIKSDEIKIIYNLDNKTPLNKWIKKVKTNFIKSISLNTPIKINERSSSKIKSQVGNIGYLSNKANNVYTNRICCIGSVDFYGEGNAGLYIFNENFNQIISSFTVRNIIKGNWVNDKDEYIAPNTKHPDYKQWNNDCIVCSLFNNSSNQSSLRNVEYKDKKWNIENQFFFMSNKQMRDLADKHNNTELYQDTKAFNKDRFVYNKLKDVKLSPDAQEILDKAKELTIKSFEYRQMLDEEYPEYNLNTWDAGWYQIKFILKNYLNDELKSFNTLYKKFDTRMSQGVYKFGFLQ